MIARLIALPPTRLLRTRSFGNISKLFGANVAGVAVSMLVAPVVSRLYSPADVGEFALVTAFAAICTPLFTMRYETAIMLPKSDDESAQVFRLTQGLAIAWLLLLGAAVYFAPEKLFRAAGYENLYHWRVAAVGAGFLTAMIFTLTACYNRARGYSTMSRAKLLQNGAYAALVVGFGWLGFRQGQILATLVSGFVTVYWLKQSLKIQPAEFSWRVARALARKHADAPCFLFPTAMLDTFTKQLPVFLITSWFSTALAGNFSIAWRLVFLPVGLVGAAVGQVFFERFARAWPDRREARRILFKTWLALAPIALMPCLVIMLTGPHLFSWALGEKWRQAGVFAALIAPLTFFVFLSSPTSNAFVVLGLQKYSLVFGLMTLIYRPACLWLGWHFHSLQIGLLFLTLAEIVQILVYNTVVLVKTAEP